MLMLEQVSIAIRTLIVLWRSVGSSDVYSDWKADGSCDEEAPERRQERMKKLSIEKSLLLE